MISEFLSFIYYWFEHCQRNNGEEENQIEKIDSGQKEDPDQEEWELY